ncbi:tripartite tricarboxylate transporter substrate binding protein [Polaromonas eurypsychrophila]|uniref:MFS transporter n=1 Tax=Polaromonas eurypsychrophila TaxID=1614635 RepID=A0A916SK01_9BURK|nr:tripartite tricarboxylate transporter substrate binding protein [Polaromonas eurypsychrophila]GGB01432.1 MFS transporter [Polaromonas eurypsychrophila]
MFFKIAKIVGVALLVASGSPAVQAQEKFPNKQVRIVVPFVAGSQVDLVAREIGRRLQAVWGQAVIVDNRPGAGGTIGSRTVATAEPDGHTLMITSASHAINPTLYKKLSYDTLRDFTGVTFVNSVPNVLVVAPSLGVKSVPELLTLIRAKPGQLNFASAGIGSGTHFNGEMFKAMAKLDIVHVPYKGTGDALVDTVAGRSALYWSPLGLTLPFIKDGKLLPLAVSTADPAPVMPNLPVISTYVPGMIYDHWYGMVAPAATPKAVVDQISAEVGRILRMPEVVKSFSDQGVIAAPTSPADFNKFIASEIQRLGAVVKSANIQID